ncbi:hypothetical protein BDV36DRAFT_264942 [Aspergillus pseudocaelatus]|uniref:Secreted protein n=1 Tax=Aspergillus pseudocaelatus TaxID=1825620 RepID=A0ABQ6WBP4_9EURO|nr:hypothetical protein BDV36DRAFT_264942 [Aspergillus pseudocaelatus]
MPRRKKLIAGWQSTYMICAFRFICSGMYAISLPTSKHWLCDKCCLRIIHVLRCGNSLGHPLSASQRTVTI